MLQRLIAYFILILVLGSCAGQPAPSHDYDLVIRNGTVYSGDGSPGVTADVAVRGDRISAIGKVTGSAARVIDAAGLAVTPGFINMLSWATESLLEDGRSQSDIRQGVTLEVMGEGWSMGPWSEAMKSEVMRLNGDIDYEIAWSTLGEYLQHLEDRGVSTNVASFVGATTVRIHVLGYEDRAPTAEELDQMRAIVRTAMEKGEAAGLRPLIYSHPLGIHGHAAGPPMDARPLGRRPEGSELRGEYPLYPNTCYAIEYSSTSSIPEWDGQDVRIGWEESGCYTEKGAEFVDGHQTALYLIR